VKFVEQAEWTQVESVQTLAGTVSRTAPVCKDKDAKICENKIYD